MREQDRTLECEHSIYGFHKQVNLGERTWNDDLRAMSYSHGIAIVVLVAEQNVILQTSLFTAGMLRSQQPRRRAAEQRDERAPFHSRPRRRGRAQLSMTRSPIRTVPAAATTAYTPAQGNCPRSPTCALLW